ncbi:hypothetical protein COLO4_35577 [Corchorus olitorius]|uniref:Uncharacterized protein n=1 Tax=Corchorus olitorius TaxID=93759 RepID=A0A1R3GF65_9ROSI|nr:hypothetical protein COLO4_35577 [Corchorus olitorius]
MVDWAKIYSELSDDSDIEVFEGLGLPLQRHPAQTGVESPPSREEGGSPEIPLIRKRKRLWVAEASSRPKAARLDASDPIFSDLPPLSQPKSSHPISVGELMNMEVGNLNKDLEDIDPKVLAERRAKQNARRAALSAPTPSAVPQPTSVNKASETSQANPALTLAQVRPQGSHPGESSAQGAGAG